MVTMELTPNRGKGRRRTLNKLLDTSITSETANDESERTSRRSIIEVQKKTQEPQSPSLNESVRFSGEQEMKDHLQICTKLFSENKITIGVAWQLHIIDLLGIMSKKGDNNILQVASTSLDIGAKVYGLRVDDLHAESLRLANSMARFAEKNQVEEKDNIAESDEEVADKDGKPVKKKRKRYNRGARNAIAKDRSTLLGEIPQLDSVFFSNRIDSTLSMVDNLFTNSLPMDKSCYKLLALGGDKAWITGPDEAAESLGKGKNSFDIDLLPRDGQICIPFQNFVLNEEEPSHEEKLIDDLVVYDNEGIPVAELDGSIHDVFKDNDFGGQEYDDDCMISEDIMAHQLQHDVPHIVDLLSSGTEIKRSEYSYNGVISLGNGKVIDQIWAGPSHWKLKCIKRNKPTFTGRMEEAQSMAKPRKKLKRNEPQPLVFTKVDDLSKILESMGKVKIKRKLYPANKITLPLPDASTHMENMFELMIKPGTVCMPKSNSTVGMKNTQDDFNGMNHFDKENNEMEFDDGMDVMDNDPGNDIQEEEEALHREQNLMGDNLVDAPEAVPKVYIPYALQAKKMDMKKLKGFVWQILTQKQEQENEINPTTFSTIFRDIPHILPQAMKKELTCSLVFSALLHLCNEKYLKLTQVSGCKDFTIESC
ncbi:condensin complex subunit 2-like [Harmonia axyridis]|uniref:condensin complex subunit 2-like n=1 Tax=Harmonia axyridis TaxID=115357 RepID=UPI001E279A3B|nr:condensin complex subunit 2-like [Harmonia axyridis]